MISDRTRDQVLTAGITTADVNIAGLERTAS